MQAGGCPEQDSNLHGTEVPKDFTHLPEVSPRHGLSLHPEARRPRSWVPGARRRGLSLGLTPLVSAPSAEPLPSAAWLRITMPRAGRGVQASLSSPGFLPTRHRAGDPTLSPLCLPIPPSGHRSETIAALSRSDSVEAATGFEPVIRALQARALPLGYAATALLIGESRELLNRRRDPEPGSRTPPCEVEGDDGPGPARGAGVPARPG